VDDTGHARLTDFGLAGVASDSGPAASATNGHAVRWAAPEVLATEQSVSQESDVYSWAMVVIEVWAPDLTPIERATHQCTYKVFTGKVPFYNSIVPAAVVVDVLSGNRPNRPTDPSLNDDLWDLAKQCWEHDPRRRPEISEVVQRLRTLSAHAEMVDSTLGSTRQEEMASGEFSFIHSSTAILSELEGSHYQPSLLAAASRKLQQLRKLVKSSLVPRPTPGEDPAHSVESEEDEKSIYTLYSHSNASSLL